MKKFHWQIARITKVVQETPLVKTFTLMLPDWQPHLPGQHYDIRLTAEDGYQAERSYSIASSPVKTGEIELTVELIEGGEISTYLFENVAVSDLLEVRGPIGGHFVWSPAMESLPLLLVAGGSGIVPLMAMLRHREATGATNPTALLYSVRSAFNTIYHDELKQLAQHSQGLKINFTFTRQPPPRWTGYERRIDGAMLTEQLNYFKAPPQCFVCGPSVMVEQVANSLVELGIAESLIRTERFGPI